VTDLSSSYKAGYHSLTVTIPGAWFEHVAHSGAVLAGTFRKAYEQRNYVEDFRPCPKLQWTPSRTYQGCIKGEIWARLVP